MNKCKNVNAIGYFHFRHNQLDVSLDVNLVCFDRISLNDNLVE